MASEWRNITLGDFVTIQRGHDLTSTERREGNVPVFGAAGQNGFHDKAIAKGPGIVIGRCGGSYGQVHYCEADFWPHNTGLYVTDFKGNDQRFAFYLLKLLNFDSYNSGSAQPSLNRNFIYPIPVRVPLPAGQKAISGVLTAFDTKIELNNRINAELEEMAKLLYDYWFVQFDFPMTAAQAAALGKPQLAGKPYRTFGGKMIYNETLKQEIPEGWENGSLENLGTIMGGGTPSTEVSGNFSADGTPWITPKDLSDNIGNRFIDCGAIGVTERGIKAASLKLLPAGSVLMSSRAPIGYLALARNSVTTNQGFKSFVPDSGYSSDFIYFTLKRLMKLIHVNASGSTFKEISGGTLKAVKTHLPPVELVQKFTEYTSSLSSQQSLLEQQNQELTQLRDWLLPMLMNGQVTVN
jgi:type I restriction enzyme S subunit